MQSVQHSAKQLLLLAAVLLACNCFYCCQAGSRVLHISAICWHSVLLRLTVTTSLSAAVCCTIVTSQHEVFARDACLVQGALRAAST